LNAKLSTDEKKQRILNVIRKLLGEKGFSGTTISQVAAEAGISRGLLHYYYKNKEEMLAHVIRANMKMSIDMIERVFNQAKSADQLAAEFVSVLRYVIENDPDFFKVFFESWAIGRQSPVISEELQSLYGRFRKELQDGLEQAVADKIISPRLPIDGLAALITGIIDGMGLQLATEAVLAENQVVWDTTEQGIAALLKGSF
jgi:AcrR family transcriptional regulator